MHAISDYCHQPAAAAAAAAAGQSCGDVNSVDTRHTSVGDAADSWLAKTRRSVDASLIE